MERFWKNVIRITVLFVLVGIVMLMTTQYLHLHKHFEQPLLTYKDVMRTIYAKGNRLMHVFNTVEDTNSTSSAVYETSRSEIPNADVVRELEQNITSLRRLVERKIRESLSKNLSFSDDEIAVIARNLSNGSLKDGDKRSSWRTPCWEDSNKLFCLPSAYIVGFPGCARTDLYYRLSAHPDVIPSWKAGAQFWNRVDIGLPKTMFNYGASLELKSMMKEKNESLILEKSVLETWLHMVRKYLEEKEPRRWNILIAQLVKKCTPNAKFIFIMYNPIKRFRHFYGFKFLGTEETTNLHFHQEVTQFIREKLACFKNHDLEDCYGKMMNDHIQDLEYLMRLKDWLAIFPLDRFYFIDTDEWAIADKRKTILRDLYKLINIGQLIDPQLKQEADMKAIDDRSYRYGYPSIQNPFPETIEIMKAFFDPFNQALGKLLKDDRFKWRNTQF